MDINNTEQNLQKQNIGQQNTLQKTPSSPKYQNPLSRSIFIGCFAFVVIISVIMGTIGYNLFQDKMMQREFLRKKERIENERKKFIASGGRIISKRSYIKPHTSPTYAKSIEDATKIGFCLPTTYSQRSLVHSESSGTDLLLQTDESNGLDELAKECYQHVRWDFSDERTRLALLTAKKILENMAEAMAEHSALSHVEYINREKAYENRGGCIFHSHHLPKWAQDDPKIFFQAADEYESVGNTMLTRYTTKWE
mgnify:CR=1 FL=1